MSDSKKVQDVTKVLKESGLLHWNEHEHAIVALASDIVSVINQPEMIPDSEIPRIKAELEAQGAKVIINPRPVNNPKK